MWNLLFIAGYVSSVHLLQEMVDIASTMILFLLLLEEPPIHVNYVAVWRSKVLNPHLLMVFFVFLSLVVN